mmetsp:Transcript_95773/g.309206  ORF Transcript_95773/g.309206 Transcript_95773/m.309206 type:complete len:334 (-) Transcript_95773:47-1048(-)
MELLCLGPTLAGSAPLGQLLHVLHLPAAALPLLIVLEPGHPCGLRHLQPRGPPRGLQLALLLELQPRRLVGPPPPEPRGLLPRALCGLLRGPLRGPLLGLRLLGCRQLLPRRLRLLLRPFHGPLLPLSLGQLGRLLHVTYRQQLLLPPGPQLRLALGEQLGLPPLRRLLPPLLQGLLQELLVRQGLQPLQLLGVLLLALLGQPRVDAGLLLRLPLGLLLPQPPLLFLLPVPRLPLSPDLVQRRLLLLALGDDVRALLFQSALLRQLPRQLRGLAPGLGLPLALGLQLGLVIGPALGLVLQPQRGVRVRFGLLPHLRGLLLLLPQQRGGVRRGR